MGEQGDETTDAAPRRGPDLAREALALARARSAARRTAAGRSSASARRGGIAGQRRRWSRAGPDTRDPQPLGATVAQWVKGAGAGGELAKAHVLARWPQIVGAELAAHCEPVSLLDGELVLQAESTAWATQIRGLAPIILGKISGAVGPNVVRRIRTQGPSRPSWRFGPRHVSGRGPRDTYG